MAGEAVRYYPGGPDDRAAAALRRYQEATHRKPPLRLTVACPGPAGHTFAKVVRTFEGLVVTGRYTTTSYVPNETGNWPPYVRRHGRPRKTEVAVLLEPSLRDNQV